MINSNLSRVRFVFTAGFALLLIACSKHERANVSIKERSESDAASKSFGVIKKLYPTLTTPLEKLSFAGLRYQAQRCGSSRITPVEDGKTTVKVLPADNCLCPINAVPSHPPACPTPVPNPDPNPRPLVTVGTPVPGADSIGRLELEVKTGPAKGTYFWATAFKVGEKKDKTTGEMSDLVVTTCHALQPLIEQPDPNQSWQYKPPASEVLSLDYGERTDYLSPKEYQVEELVAYGQKPGLDVALLKVEHSSAKVLPFEPSTATASSFTVPFPITVIGYVDFLHPVDPLIDMSYNPFLRYGDNKFVSFGRFTQVSRDEASNAVPFGPQNYMYHDAATSMGQSGSPVFKGEDLKPLHGEPLVLAVHVCCTAYWSYDKGEPPVNDNSIPCGRITRGIVNKAVLSRDILSDPALCGALKDYGVKCP